MPLGSQNLDAIYRTSCPSTQDLTSSLHMFCCHVLNGLPTCLQVMLHAKLAMTGAGQKAVSLSSLVCGLHQIGNILDHICEHGSWHGCCITYEACTCWEFRTFLFPPAGQLTIFRKRKNPEVPSTKHALHLIKIFLNTWQNQCLEILTIPLQRLSFNFHKECEPFYIFSPSVNFLDIKIFPLFCMLVFYTALLSGIFFYNPFSDIILIMHTLQK